MNNLTEYNYIEIILFVIVFLALLVIISILGINLNPTISSPKLIQEVTIESFNNPQEQLDLIQEVNDLKLFPMDSFCETHLGNAGQLEEACSRLTKQSCLETNCCVYTNLGKCVAGSKFGPTYLKNNEGIDHYYYQNKQFFKK